MYSRIPFKNFLQRLMRDGLEAFGRHYSSYRGFVLSNKDPKNLDRVFVYVPHISGWKKHGQWAWPKGKSYTNREVPKNGDMVWVEFESGDYRYPIWSFANQTEALGQSTPHDPESKNYHTEKGHTVFMDDRNDVLGLKHVNGSEIKISKDKIEIFEKEGATVFLSEEQIAIQSPDGSKILMKDGEISFNGGSNQGLVKVEDLVNKLNNLENALNNHIHPSPAGPTSPITPDHRIILTKKDDLENEAIRH